MVMAQSKRNRLSVAVEKIKRLLRREPRFPEEDPHVYVTSPKKPRPPYRSAAAVADKPED
jgi:hypothetical protein